MMAWFRVDDGFHSHPKVAGLSLSARGLWVTAGSWCGQHLTDGHVPKKLLRVWGARPKQAAELVESGLWETVGDDYAFHDWHNNNPTRESVVTKRAEDAKRKRDSRASPSGREVDSGATLDGVHPPCARPRGRPGPSLPVPTQPREAPPPPDSAAPPSDPAVDWIRVLKLAESAVPELCPPGSLTLAANRHREDAHSILAFAGSVSACEPILRRWAADPYVQERRLSLGHLAGNLAKYSRARTNKQDSPESQAALAALRALQAAKANGASEAEVQRLTEVLTAAHAAHKAAKERREATA